jgi:hypothetical protein
LANVTFTPVSDLLWQTVAHGRELHRGHRVKEASRQASEPPITQARVGFLFE